MPKRIVVGSSCAAALLSVMAVAATGQSAPQSPSPRGTESPTQSRPQGERSAADQQITVVGCVVNESDLRGGGAASADRSRDAASTSRSGGNEFVLVNAQIMPAGATASSGTGGSTSSATGTSGSSGARAPAASGDRASASPGATFSLTGDRERELSK